MTTLSESCKNCEMINIQEGDPCSRCGSDMTHIVTNYEERELACDDCGLNT